MVDIKVKNKNNNTFQAFSLAEVLLSMLILTTFIIGTMKVTTTLTSRQKSEISVYPHGLYECYYNGSSLRKYYSYQGSKIYDKDPDNSQYCIFDSPKGVGYLDVTVIFANSQGAYSFQEPFADTKVKYQPPTTSNGNTAQFVNVENTAASLTYVASSMGGKSMATSAFRECHKTTNPESAVVANTSVGAAGKNGAIIVSW